MNCDTHYLSGWWPAEPRLAARVEIACKNSCDCITVHICIYLYKVTLVLKCFVQVTESSEIHAACIGN